MSGDEPATTPARRRAGALLGLAAIVLAVAGVVLITLALTGDDGERPPQPPRAQPTIASTSPTTGPTTGQTTGPTVGSTIGPSTRPDDKPGAPTTPLPTPTPKTTIDGPVLDRSTPVAIDIPAIDVHSDLLNLGLNKDRTVEVPPLDDPDSKAGWYRYSPTPGELGPAIILGHVDSAKYGPGIFFELGALKKGDEISVRRKDGSVAVFRVDDNVRYPKSQFPTKKVYGNLNHAGLRLITCGGTFDFSARSYEDNIVVYASLIESR